MPFISRSPVRTGATIFQTGYGKSILPGGKGKTGRPAQDNRRFINAMFWILPRRPLAGSAPGHRDWKNTHRRFCRWRDRIVWAGLLEAVMDDPDYEWLMIDASYWPIPTASGPGAATKPLPAQKGAQQQAAPGGLPRNAGKAGGDRRHCG